MVWNPRRIFGRLTRERADTAAAITQEAGVEEEEAAATADIVAFEGGLLAEDRLIRALGGLQRKKYTALRAVSAAHAASSKLSIARRQLLGRLSAGRKRLANLGMKARVSFSGARIIDPGFGQKMALWEQQQAREIQVLERETALAIQEERQEATSVGPIIQVNKEIRAKLKEYSDTILAEDRRLIDAVNKELEEIRRSRAQLAEERDALNTEIQNLRQQRGVPVR